MQQSTPGSRRRCAALVDVIDGANNVIENGTAWRSTPGRTNGISEARPPRSPEHHGQLQREGQRLARCWARSTYSSTPTCGATPA